MSDTENVQMIFITFNSAISCITVYLTYYCVKKLCGIRLAVLGYIFLRYKCLYVAVDKYPLLGSAYGIRPCNDIGVVHNDTAMQ